VLLAPGIAEAVDFTLHPAIRNGTGQAGDCAADSFSCPDEDCGCPYTRWALCGMQATPLPIDLQVRFLTCYDSQNIPFSSDWVTYDEMPNPMQAAQQCIEDLSLDWAPVQTCGGNITGDFASGNYTEVIGEQSMVLATEASTYFYDTFFKARTGVKFYVPNVYLTPADKSIDDNVEQNLNNLVDMWNLTKTLCNYGADASICSVAQQAGNPNWFGDSPREVEDKHPKHDHTKVGGHHGLLTSPDVVV
jgi:hypothetical protein